MNIIDMHPTVQAAVQMWLLEALIHGEQPTEDEIKAMAAELVAADRALKGEPPKDAVVVRVGGSVRDTNGGER